MRKLLIGAVATAFAAFALVSMAQADDVGVAVDLHELNGSGITGSAELGSTTDDLSTTTVMVDMGGLEPNVSHLNHIHTGTGCGDGEYGGVVITLEELAADGAGSANATTLVTQLDDTTPVSFTDIADGNHVIIVHDSQGVPAACAAIPAAIVATPTTTAPAPTATVAVVSVPATGLTTDGGGMSGGLVALIVGGVMALGVATLGAGFAVRRRIG